MNGGAVVAAIGAISSLGEGRDAFAVGSPGAPARVTIGLDDALARAGLAHPFVARAALPHDDAGDPATALLLFATLACAKELDVVRPRWRQERVGLAIGTSSGGMRSAERMFCGDHASAEGATYFAGIHAAAQALALDLEPATLVLGACAASTIAIGLGLRWLREGACDVVLAGGFDAVSVFVAAGFEVLRATSAAVPPRPFRVGRDGMALGEGAAVLALVSPRASAEGARGYIAGFGASGDAVHLTAPDRTGAGLARAAEAALADAGIAGSQVDLVSAHATATPFNDAAECLAITRVLGSAERAVVHPFKAQIGHTLGAAGALETLACLDALERGVLPAAAGSGAIDPAAKVRLLELAASGDPAVAIKLSAAFGGANATLVLSRREPVARTRPSRAVHLTEAFHVAREPDLAALAVALGRGEERLTRCDALCRWALAALAGLAERVGPLAGAGVVVGQSFATVETNLLFHKRIDERGARMAEPRRFPYTSPNAVAGEASVAFGLTGPSFAVGAGLHAGVEALAIAAHLVRAGDADRIVVVAVDEVGPAVARLREHPAFASFAPVSGAVAVLVTADPNAAAARVVRTRLTFGPRAPRGPTRVGHLALLPWLESPRPSALESSTPFPAEDAGAAYARVDLESL